jgi:hypothetical protein
MLQLVGSCRNDSVKRSVQLDSGVVQACTVGGVEAVSHV